MVFESSRPLFGKTITHKFRLNRQPSLDWDENAFESLALLLGKSIWRTSKDKATVVTLVPIAKHPLDYTICLDDGGVEHNLPADSLEPLTYWEEGDEPGEPGSDVTIIFKIISYIVRNIG